MKRQSNIILLVAALLLAYVIVSAQTKHPPCNDGSKISVVAPAEIEGLVKQLNSEGYCLDESNFKVLGDGSVLVVVGKGDLENSETEPILNGGR